MLGLAFIVLPMVGHDPHVNAEATGYELVVEDVLHDVILFLLTEVKACIAKTDIGIVVFERCADVGTPFDIVSLGFAEKVGVDEVIEVLIDGVALDFQFLLR